MTDQSDHVVLPRAAVEEIRERLAGSASEASHRLCPTAQWFDRHAEEIDALLAAAKGVESLGRHEALTDSGALPDEPQFYVDPSVPLSGFYEIFYADAAEEGE